VSKNLVDFFLLRETFLTLYWWWCYPTPSEVWRRPNSRATPQSLDQRSNVEKVVPKMLWIWTFDFQHTLYVR